MGKETIPRIQDSKRHIDGPEFSVDYDEEYMDHITGQQIIHTRCSSCGSPVTVITELIVRTL